MSFLMDIKMMRRWEVSGWRTFPLSVVTAAMYLERSETLRQFGSKVFMGLQSRCRSGGK